MKYFIVLALTLVVSISAVSVNFMSILDGIGIPSTIRTGKLPGDGNRETIFAAELSGKIWAIPEIGSPYVFVDLTNRVLPPNLSDGDYGFQGMDFTNLKKDGFMYFYYAKNGTVGPSLNGNTIDPCNESTLTDIWNTTLYHHINVLEEWFYNENNGSVVFVRTLLNIKWPNGFNPGFSNLRIVDDLDNTLLVALGSATIFDRFNLAQDDDFPHGKLLALDVDDQGWEMTNPIAKISDISDEISNFIAVVGKGLRNIVGLDIEKTGDNLIKYIGMTGESTADSIFTFVDYEDEKTGQMINFGWRAWEGVVDTKVVNDCGSRTTAYYQQAIDLAAKRWPSVLSYYHDDTNPNTISASTIVGIAPYRGDIEGLKNKLIFADFSGFFPNGALAFTTVNKDNLKDLQSYEIITVTNDFPDFLNFYADMSTSIDRKRMFIGIIHGFDPADGEIYEIVEP
jgi:hypothetical protein